MAFENEQFPVEISVGSSGGPSYYTDVGGSTAGIEKRNVNWPIGRHKFDVSYGIRDFNDLYAVVNLFHAMQGRAYSFRFRDPLDNTTSSTQNGVPMNVDEVLVGDVDGINKDFQLVKRYTRGSRTVTRIITKPVPSSVSIAIDSVDQPSGWSLDPLTGTITFTTAPAIAEVVTGGCQFDIPVRFDEDTINVNYDYGTIGGLSINVIEVDE